MTAHTAKIEHAWGNITHENHQTPTKFRFVSWFHLPKLERLILPFYSLGMWAELIEHVEDQGLQLVVTNWDKQGTENSAGSPQARANAAVSVLQAL